MIWIILIILTYYFLSKQTRKLDYSKIQQYETFAKQESMLYPDINWELIQAIIYVESRGNSQAIGKANEIGLMQITEIALTDVNEYLSGVEGLRIEKQSLFLSRMNIHAGATYLFLRFSHWNRFPKEGLRPLELAIRSYNAGDKAVMMNTDSKTYLDTVRDIERQIKELR